MSRVARERRRHPARRAGVTVGSAAALLAATLVPITGASADNADTTDLGDAADHGISGVTDTFMPAATSPTGAWFVQLEGDPTTQGGSSAAIASSQDEFAETAEELDVDVEVRQTFSTLWNGVAIDASDEDAAVLSTAESVVAIYPVLEVQAPTSPPPSVPDMVNALGMTGADIAQSELGLTGEGIRVGVIDTGVDYDHPDLGGSGVDDPANFPNDRVVAGYDFVGDDYNADDSAADWQPVPHPDADPDDCQGHGTHVAGIVGASGDPAEGGVRGVAPDAQIGAYRVFGCTGSTTADIMLAAMEQALADGMDVVNQSIGSAFSSWPQYPTAVGSDNLVDAGVVMVASIGNEGDLGLYASGAPGVGEKVIGVASYDNTMMTGAAISVDDQLMVYMPASASPEPPTSGSLPVSVAGEPGTDEGRSCDGIEADMAGTVALIQRGACPEGVFGSSFYEKALNAQEAGAAAAIIYNNVPGLLNPTVEGEVEITIPVIFIDLEDGLAIYESAIDDGAEMVWTDETAQAPNPTGGLVSAFSSFGLAADLSLKPDLGAPGGSIWSTLPMEQGSYGSNSGTSMASPHVAGAAALFLQQHGDAEPADVRDALLNSADPSLWSLNDTIGLLEPVNHQGAGLLDIDDAILATTVVSPSKLSLGESEGGPVTNTIEVTNNGTAPVTYEITYEDAITTGQNPADGDSADVPGFYYDDSIVEAPSSITVNPGHTESFDVSISPSESFDLAQYGGYVYLINGDEQISIPYAGFAGDYQSLPVLTPGDYGFPALAALDTDACERLVGVDCTMGGSWDLVEAGQVYSMADGDVPTILAHLDAPVSNLTIDVYQANEDGTRGDKVHPRFYNYLDTDFVGRTGGGPNVFVPYTWDGTVNHRENDRAVPDGDYILVLSVVNALGNPEVADHTESYETQSFTIDRDGDGNPPPPPAETPLEKLIKLLGKILAKIVCKILGIC